MASDGKLYIIVTDHLPGRVNPVTPGNEGKESKDDKNALKDWAQHRFLNFLESQAKQLVNYSISNIGNFTGDYIKQQQVASVVSLVNLATDITVGAIAGAKYGPAGALIGAGIVVATKAIGVGEQILSNAAETSRQNRQIAQLRDRAGLNSTNNGSRGTEY